MQSPWGGDRAEMASVTATIRRTIMLDELWQLFVGEDPVVGEDNPVQSTAGSSYSVVIMEKTTWLEERGER